MSMQYLQGAVIDYKEELMGASFTIKNLAKSGMLYESGLKPYFRRGKSSNY